jgi:hypothetical protein
MRKSPLNVILALSVVGLISTVNAINMNAFLVSELEIENM